PIGEEHEFSGVLDLLGRKAYRYSGDPTGAEEDWSADETTGAEPFRERLAEAVAEADDALLEKYLESGELTGDEIAKGVRAGLAAARFAPVLAGAAATPIGVDRLLTFIADEFPSPLDRPG